MLQLLLIEWGILGPGDLPAGMFLAYHHSALGPYFGNTDGHNWPSDPLSKDPTPLESSFNEETAKMTELLSNGTLKNTSLLDFPAFGSKIAYLRLQHKITPNWPTELNFAIQRGKGNKDLGTLFNNYKIMLNDWKHYLGNTSLENDKAVFTPEMEKNENFNFTKYINFEEFLIATHGSFLTAMKEKALPVWSQTAKTLFNQGTIDILENGQYDKLIMECAFRVNLFTKRNYDLDGGCKYFHPTLTTNGFCYTFNAAPIEDVWRSSEVIDEFKNLFPSSHSKELFRGSGEVEGKFINMRKRF